jgi:hypothetical protein
LARIHPPASPDQSRGNGHHQDVPVMSEQSDLRAAICSRRRRPGRKDQHCRAWGCGPTICMQTRDFAEAAP